MNPSKSKDKKTFLNKVLSFVASFFAYLVTAVLVVFELIIKVALLPFSYSFYYRFFNFEDISDEENLTVSSIEYDNIRKKVWIVSLIIFAFILIGLLFFPPIQSNQGDWLYTLCEDGWISQSRGSGTCSWHGGIDYYVYEELPDTYLIWPYIVFLISSLSVGLIQMRFAWNSFVKTNHKHKEFIYYQIQYHKKYFISLFTRDFILSLKELGES